MVSSELTTSQSLAHAFLTMHLLAANSGRHGEVKEIAVE